MDKRRKISVKDAKQIAYEALQAGVTRERIISAQKTLGGKQYEPFEKGFDSWFDMRISLTLDPPKEPELGNDSSPMNTFGRDNYGE